MLSSDSFSSADLNQAEDWKTLHELSFKLLKPDTLQHKLERVLETAAHFHSTTRGIVSTYDPTTGTLKITASLGMSQRALDAIDGMPLGVGTCGKAFVEKRRVIVDDLLANPDYAQFHALAKLEGIASIYSTPFFDSDGEPLGTLTVYFDTVHYPTEREKRLADICAGTIALFSDRDRTEHTLRQERDRRDQILSGMTEGMCIVDFDFRVLEMNAAAIRINQRPLYEMLGQSHWDLWPETTDSEVGQMYRRAMKERVKVQLENRWEDPSGRTGWFQLTAQPIDEGLALYFTDITERKNAEEAVRASEQRYRILSETVSAVVWRTDAQGTPLDNQASWKAFFGQPMEVDIPWAEVVYPEDQQITLDCWRETVASGKPNQFSFRVTDWSGKVRYLMVHAVPLKNSQGEIFEWIGSCEDITDAKNREESLHTMNERKDDFLAVLSHELRNPLSATRMAAQLLENPSVSTSKVSHLAQVIGRQVGHMSRLVEDLIDVSRVSQGLVILNKVKVDLRSVLANGVEQVRPMFVAKNHVLVVEFPEEEECMVLGDQTRLVQVVANLLSNAARYTPPAGHIVVAVASTATMLRITVTDNGIGLDPQTSAHLFDYYVQAERSADGKNGGLGLGLALVKSLIELHGGNVSATSDGLDLGSTFTIELPKAH